MASNKFLEETGLSRLWAHTKQYANDTFSHGFGGGENLLKQSEKGINLNIPTTGISCTVGKISVNANNGSMNAGAFGLDYMTVQPSELYVLNEELTLSVDVKTENITNDNAKLCLSLRNVDHTNSVESFTVLDKNKNGKWYRISTTLKMTQVGQDNIYLLFRFLNNKGATVEYKNWKLERGAIATPWSLAPSENLIKVTDYQMLNGIANTDGDSLIIANFPTHQVVYVNIWLHNMNLTQAWQKKGAISIPLKYFRFKNVCIASAGADEYWDSNAVLSGSLNVENGIITVQVRNKGVEATRLRSTYLIY